jgi:hypothetical protein
MHDDLRLGMQPDLFTYAELVALITRRRWKLARDVARDDRLRVRFGEVPADLARRGTR